MSGREGKDLKKTACFDAVVDFTPVEKKNTLDVLLLAQGKKISASFHFYERFQKEKQDLFFIRVHTGLPLALRWKDNFEVQGPGKRRILGKGYVLNTFSEKISQEKIKKRVSFLKYLLGDEKKMLFGLVKEKGLQGLREREIMDFSYLTRKKLLNLTQQLETEGEVRILSFTPLLLLSQESLEFLSKKILFLLSFFHQKHSDLSGLSLEKIEKRFNLHPRILSLALKNLLHSGQINQIEDKFALSDFKIILTPEEEKTLGELENLCLKGEFHLYSFKDLQQHFHCSEKKLHKMLSFLIERKKIIQGKDGLLIHSRWLDEIISKIRKSGKREMSVADFKELTGLTRKFAIPLLELLDQMGVTRRKGSLREVL